MSSDDEYNSEYGENESLLSSDEDYETLTDDKINRINKIIDYARESSLIASIRGDDAKSCCNNDDKFILPCKTVYLNLIIPHIEDETTEVKVIIAGLQCIW